MCPEAQRELLNIESGPTGILLTSPAAATAWRLEATPDPALAGTPITMGITVEGTNFSYRAPRLYGRQFFRLRRD